MNKPKSSSSRGPAPAGTSAANEGFSRRLASKESEATHSAQKEELEALTSIFGNDLRLEKSIWGNAAFTVLVRLLGQDSVGASYGANSVEVGIVYSAKYPKTPPTIDVRNPKGAKDALIPDDELKILKSMLTSEADRLSEGAQPDPYLFELFRVAQDFLINRAKTMRGPARKVTQIEEVSTKGKQKIIANESELPGTDLQALEEEARARKREAWLVEQQELEFDDTARKQPSTVDIKKVVPEVEDKPSVEASRIHQGRKGGRYYTDYEDLGAVGRGGFGHVYKARNRLDNSIYAVKKIRLESDETLNRKTRSEAITLAKLVHPNIVRYFSAWLEEDDGDGDNDEDEESDEFDEYSESEPSILRPASSFTGFLSNDGDDDGGGFDWDEGSVDSGDDESSRSKSKSSVSGLGGRAVAQGGKLSRQSGMLVAPKRQVLYIVMEFVPRTMRSLIDSKELIGKDSRCFELIRETLDALSCVHELHIIHQDIKPENLLIDEQGRVKIGDFGLAVQQEAGERDKAEVGTTYYRAPEVGKGNWDERCDIFSLGVVMVEMFCPPTETNMERHKMLTNLRLDPPVLPEKFSNDEAIQLAFRMLQKDPKHRPSAAQALKTIPGHVLVEHAVDTVIKSLTPGSNAFNRLLKHLFSQSTTYEVDAAYDYDPAAPSTATEDSDLSSLRHSSRALSELAAVNALPPSESLLPVSREIATSSLEVTAVIVCERTGAVRFRAPLLVPQRDDLTVRRAVSFLDPMGVCVSLPHGTLTRNFARFVALNRNIRSLKRFDVGMCFSKAGGGGQPIAQRQLCLDAAALAKDLGEDGARVLVIEQIEAMREFFALVATRLGGGVTIEIGHAGFLPALFEATRVPQEMRSVVLQAVRKQEFFRDWKHAADVLTKEASCPIGAAQAMKFCLPFTKAVWQSGGNGELIPPLQQRARSVSQIGEGSSGSILGGSSNSLLGGALGSSESSVGQTGSIAADDEEDAHRRSTTHRKKATAMVNNSGTSSILPATHQTSGSTKLHPVEMLIEQAQSAKMTRCTEILKEMWAVTLSLIAGSANTRVRFVLWGDVPVDVTGLYFRMTMRRRRAVVRGGVRNAGNAQQGNKLSSVVYEEGPEFVAADGGRFDGLIAAFAQPLGVAGVPAGGNMVGASARIYLDRIAKLRAHFTVENVRKRPLVRVCWPVEKDAARFECDERSRLASRLRAEFPGVGIEWMHPKDLSGDALLALCRELGSRVMVTKVSPPTVVSSNQSVIGNTQEIFRVRGWAFPPGSEEVALHMGVFSDKRCESWVELVRLVSQIVGSAKM